MPLAWKEKPLTMEWCLDCHRHPERHVRPKEAVFVMDWQPDHSKGGTSKAGIELVRDSHIQVEQLVNCSICHR